MLSSTDQLQVIRIGRSKVVIDPLHRLAFYNLYAGGMARAGFQFQWLGEADQVGLGVNFKVLSFCNASHLTLCLFLKDDWVNCYVIHPQAFLDFSLRYRAFVSIKGTLIYLCSVSLFKIVPSDYYAVKDLLVGQDDKRY